MRPWLGVLPHFRKDPAGYLLSVAREYGDLAYMRLGPQHAFVVSHPDAIRDSSHFSYSTLKRGFTRQIHSFGPALPRTSSDVARRRFRLGLAGISARVSAWSIRSP